MVRETQTFVNQFMQGHEAWTPLRVDGIQGPKTQSAIARVLTRLRIKFEREGLAWAAGFNFIGIRTNSRITNVFDDWFVLAWENTLVAIPASTKAGLPAVAKYANALIRGKRGFGTIKENQQIDYLVVEPQLNGGAWVNWAGGTGFLYQDKPIDVYRDPNRDNIIDRTVLVRGDLGGGFNVHSWAGWFSAWVQNLSEGCQVCQINYWQIIFTILVRQARRVGDQKRLTYTLLQWI